MSKLRSKSEKVKDRRIAYPYKRTLDRSKKILQLLVHTFTYAGYIV